MNLALFGGSFDPVHKGHNKLVRLALKSLDIDLLVIMPAFCNPFKDKTLLDSKTRLRLCKKAFSSFDRVEVSDYEVLKKDKSYTIDTVRYLKEKFKPKKFYLLLGEDNLKSLESWKDYKDLKKLVSFVVFSRHGYEEVSRDSKFIYIDMDEDISSSSIRKRLESIKKDLWEEEILKSLGENMDYLESIKTVLEDKKASNVEVLNLKDKDYISDYVVVATAMAPKHAEGLLNYLKDDLKPKGAKFYAVDDSNSEWIIADLGEIIVHILTEEYRNKYQLEDFLKEEFLTRK
ncbi:nicotinate (nicotinamide) nucleotide adenylyltransferase [Helicobacter sp. 11S02629-2]|uniref:nicotinate (nicotinamide) nucleotide adenylyltransferase n=1 Tax=Helicobacter sp. 11S02629-2 TaxID=1476195 RepID=UPI000BA57320|nr:nicotinate (nicotinamide) nucleotide adenylyltransferase [Helicobacter sp. 11S02629-2]PAF45938.1 hypothetical protein BKH40_00565 [Helicobacter sp. 11S02629-2]